MFDRRGVVVAIVKVRFEPLIIVVPEQITDYYESELVAKLEADGNPVPPLELVEEQIRQILTIEGTNSEMDNWVQNERRKARVEVLLFRTPPLSPNVPQDATRRIELHPIEEKPPGMMPR